MERLQILVKGQVQGVGFRPQVYRIAQGLNLTGWVQNNTSGVLIEIQGKSAPSFLDQLLSSLPPLAKIHAIETRAVALIEQELAFQIIESKKNGAASAMITPDLSPCNDCLKELFDPLSHYYYYPFLNCTQCGPRFTITRALPYDRCQTSMNEFALCPSCKEDYLSPMSRRYHAQPTACKNCGPALSHSIESIANALRAGQIIALKGVGGYQLLCDARDKEAITRLRQKKIREAKPLALMALNCASIEEHVLVSLKEKESLLSQTRPIVVLKKKTKILPEALAPGLSFLGMMLPSSPLHYLVFHALAGYPEHSDWLDKIHPWVLVATSANLAGNPLLINDEKAKEELRPIADLVISYNREIFTRVDDSVVRVINNAPRFLRRARGFSPIAIHLPHSIPSTLALGGHLKNTFCISRGDEALVSQHIGSLTNKATLDFFHESLAHWLRFLNVRLERIACDLHPDFYTTSLAAEYKLPVISVQHHHAHLAAVAAEHHILRPSLGLALDGHGYGLDGKAWGGELFLIENIKSIKRLGHFYPLPLPGGERAIYEPWRMGASVLHCLQKDEEMRRRFSTQPQVDDLIRLLKNKNFFTTTSSCGRLFDAASALLGINTHSNYEGQAAMQLESLVTTPEVLSQGWSYSDNLFNFLPTFSQLLVMDPVQGANYFHGTLIAGLAEWIKVYAKKTSINLVLLSGGCFLNQVLTEGLVKQLEKDGFEVYLPKELPPNDGGLSLGQAWIAGNYLEAELLCA